MILSRMTCAAVLVSATALASLQGAAAAPLAVNAGISNAMSSVDTVQYRHGGPGWRNNGGWRHGGDGYRYRGGYGHRHYGSSYYGNGAAALGGLAAGAIIGGAIANSNARANTDGYCSQRFKSYDPDSGTYLGYDGARHPCP